MVTKVKKIKLKTKTKAKDTGKTKPVKKLAKTAKTAKTSRTANVAATKPIKRKFTKTELFDKIAEKTELERRQVAKVMAVVEQAICGSVMPGSIGEFMLSGLFKIVTKKVPAKKMPAIKKGTPVRNPSTGEMMPSKGRAAFTKPATVRVKIRPMAKLKKAAAGL